MHIGLQWHRHTHKRFLKFFTDITFMLLPDSIRHIMFSVYGDIKHRIFFMIPHLSRKKRC
ncbi:hypothetical protein Hanom_Chr01g00025541 [Helianthus anomalus]